MEHAGTTEPVAGTLPELEDEGDSLSTAWRGARVVSVRARRLRSSVPFLFGDSPSDAGNAYALRTIRAGAGNWTRRFSNGKDWADRLAKAFVTRSDAFERGGTNYAASGAYIQLPCLEPPVMSAPDFTLAGQIGKYQGDSRGKGPIPQRSTCSGSVTAMSLSAMSIFSSQPV